jgi:hypothetical protein
MSKLQKIKATAVHFGPLADMPPEQFNIGQAGRVYPVV